MFFIGPQKCEHPIYLICASSPWDLQPAECCVFQLPPRTESIYLIPPKPLQPLGSGIKVSDTRVFIVIAGMSITGIDCSAQQVEVELEGNPDISGMGVRT